MNQSIDNGEENHSEPIIIIKQRRLIYLLLKYFSDYSELQSLRVSIIHRNDSKTFEDNWKIVLSKVPCILIIRTTLK